jgi:ADP-dependent NAD(P)H-hydrate dehydratase / NAD(P)H-hydrate epimerase
VNPGRTQEVPDAYAGAVIPVLTPDEMREVDESADVPLTTLIDRAAAAVAREAVRMLGGTYGRVVHVIAGPGNNGADGRGAAALLARRGVRTTVFSAAACPSRLPPADLVIDAAYGTGLRGEWFPPEVGDIPVLAVDIPSGLDGLTGAVRGGVLGAHTTVTFAAAKPGVFVGAGRSVAGRIVVADIGLDVSAARLHQVEPADVAGWLVPRAAQAHKWSHAVRVVAGSPGMTGAAHLTAAAAQRSGAGIVHLSSPGIEVDGPVEAVTRRLPAFDWSTAVLSDLHRFHALVIGPGLGREDYTVPSVTKVVAESVIPVLVDGDGLFALSWNPEGAPTMLREREVPTLLTPHDGEYALLTGAGVGPDRVAAARRLASATGATVLLKGPVTVVADPGGSAMLITNGDQRLATAGSGDVLSGIIAGLIASGVALTEAAAAGAWIHAEAANALARSGMVASDVIGAIPEVVERLQGPG